MVQSGKRKIEFMLTLDEVGTFFRKFGEDLDKGVLQVGETSVDMEGFRSLGLSLKEEAPGVRVKVKIKFPKAEDECGCLEYETDEDEDPDDADELLRSDPEDEFACVATRPKPKYKSLKKRMKGQFKAIKAAVGRGELPPSNISHAFARDCEQMLTYPGKGDEYYESYGKLLQEFLMALADQNVDAFREAVYALDAGMHACHERYK